jgi:hypothetical protein
VGVIVGVVLHRILANLMLIADQSVSEVKHIALTQMELRIVNFAVISIIKYNSNL